MNLKDKLGGKFIVFDGPDGSGKSTQLRLLAERLEAEGLAVVRGKDPGGTDIGNRIRSVLLDFDLSRMDVRCETFLFMASRAQLVGELVEPAIKAGKVVLCDRFISATCAYQGAAGYDIQRIIEVGRYAVGDTWPDLTVIVDVPTELGFERIGRSPHQAGRRRRGAGQQTMMFADAALDAMESRPIDYHRQVRKLMLNLPREYPGRVEVVDGAASAEEVHQRVMEIVNGVDF